MHVAKIKMFSYLYIRFANKANKHEKQNRINVVIKTGPVVDLESGYKGSHQHKEDRARSKDSTTHKQNLVPNIWHRNVVIDLNSSLIILEKIHNISDSGWYPSTTLVEKFTETFRSVRVRV